MSQFELWVKGCEINNTILWLLEGSGENAFYKTTTAHLVNHNYIYSAPVFHVWIDGVRKIATTSYLNAYSCYEKHIKEKEQETGR